MRGFAAVCAGILGVITLNHLLTGRGGKGGDSVAVTTSWWKWFFTDSFTAKGAS